MKDEHRAKLLELAARRGEKGFSRIVSEAIEKYLKEEVEGVELRRRAILTRGRLKVKEAESLRAATRELRHSWR
ncbi:hypothetical protein MYX82_07595 [Acidobacteria bacterium AH-259-D05]|nr:hypothetical protein [Acidobacteria bacterium AH-259-D05]